VESKPFEQPERGPDGRFPSGNKESRGRGRPRGSPNRITKSIRERVLAGFNNPDDPSGDGITAFVNELKKDYPPAAAGLLARMLPSGDSETPTGTGGVAVLQPVLIPKECFLTKEQMEAIAKHVLPDNLTIDASRISQ
jgi:hypothetical protein